ncbi:MAG: carbohydrate porin [Candidatus Omnitrophica bacterium]|nr:carbohydrate porin [Candidatus Omnitrophota bacterium]
MIFELIIGSGLVANIFFAERFRSKARSIRKQLSPGSERHKLKRSGRTRAITAAAFTLIFGALWSASALASDDDLIKEIAVLKSKLAELDQLKERVAELEKQVSENSARIVNQQCSVDEVKKSLKGSGPAEGIIRYSPGEGVEIMPCGFKINADATSVIQGTPNANNSGENNASRADASWTSDIFISKAFDSWALALIHLEPGQGAGLEDQMSLYSNVNRDAGDTSSHVLITELWYEQYLADAQITLTAGKLDPANYLDQNEYAFNETTQFLGRVFRNSPAIEWPGDNTLGGVITVAPEMFPYLAVNAAYHNADASWKEVFDKPFISSELNILPAKALGYDENMWGGNYRVYWWYNGLDHQKLVPADESPSETTKSTNMGYGLSFDQKVTDIFGVFARAGYERPEVLIVSTNPSAAPIEGTWSGGIQVSGKCWKRDRDILAFAVGQLFPSERYKDAGNGGAAEGHFETYYNCKITDNLAISPDFQWIVNPRGISEPYQGSNSPIFVYGVRAQLDF